MNDKFSLDELLIRAMPGGFFIAFLYFLYGGTYELALIDGLDFFYTFIFFCSAYIAGELLQTLAREMEWIIDLFFKLRRPSQIFLYKDNPVLKSERTRSKLLKAVDLTASDLKIANKAYTELPICFGRKKDHDDLQQSIFWKLYTEVRNTDEMKISNRNYLFVRVITIEFLLIGALLLFSSYCTLGIFSLLLSSLFLWRSRGVARGLVFQTVLLNLKKK